MSHISTIELRVESIAALTAAGKRLGFTLEPAVKFNWYGDFAGDTPESRALIAAGVDPREYEKCAYVLKREGAFEGAYNIGVVKLDDGAYELRIDSWGNGQALVDACGGLDLPKLCEEYTYAVSEDYLQHEGYETHREVVDGSPVCVGVQ